MQFAAFMSLIHTSHEPDPTLSRSTNSLQGIKLPMAISQAPSIKPVVILHWLRGTLGGPVNRGGENGDILRGGVEVLRDGLRVRLAKTETHVLLELLKAHVRELVVSEGVSNVLLSVVGLNQIVIVGEVLKHVDEVVTGLHFNTVLTKPVKELGLIELTVVNITSGDGGGRDSDDSGTVHGE